MNLSAYRHLSLALLALSFCLPALAQETGSAQPPAPGPDLVAEPDFSGRWYSHFGYLDLVQTGPDVRGTYSCCRGEITGQIKGPMLEFLWKDPIYGEGWGHFYLQEEGRKILGGWGEQDAMGVQGPWNAVRFEETGLPGEPLSFRVESTHPQFGNLEATALLVFTGDQVSGVLRGAYRTTVRDEPFRQEVFHLLEGTSEGDRVTLQWRDPIDEETGEITLTRQDGRLVGSWQAEGASAPEEISFTTAEDSQGDDGEAGPPVRKSDSAPAPESGPGTVSIPAS